MAKLVCTKMFGRFYVTTNVGKKENNITVIQTGRKLLYNIFFCSYFSRDRGVESKKRKLTVSHACLRD